MHLHLYYSLLHGYCIDSCVRQINDKTSLVRNGRQWRGWNLKMFFSLCRSWQQNIAVITWWGSGSCDAACSPLWDWFQMHVHLRINLQWANVPQPVAGVDLFSSIWSSAHLHWNNSLLPSQCVVLVLHLASVFPARPDLQLTCAQKTPSALWQTQCVVLVLHLNLMFTLEYIWQLLIKYQYIHN